MIIDHESAEINKFIKCRASFSRESVLGLAKKFGWDYTKLQGFINMLLKDKGYVYDSKDGFYKHPSKIKKRRIK